MVQIVPLLQKRVLGMYNWSPVARKFLEHPAGPFTIFFWCPMIKWCITFANIKDLKLPTQQINSKQQAAIALSGLIWTRYCFVITPVNYSLAAVNFFMGLSGCYQLFRKWQAGQLLD
ncbi:hypothetical protein TTHERM_00145360 (macronuclear) [Tetrahymena thermophila SB210]|uniref:Mitochondrial pyruvate carrier n=1 Tax=Tetrahymena thermophila (strain SB210) TaxID=312017 RepID=I7MDT7_TETTS|nr:hypothetical protein TTHERM_00145360 [Tetrahymena thermophila SB210]EAR90931.2 hypothetical protein TTHERM_00145360 [Tetrahymena thermophila SB210]|eukprot:XP_001011176.2 hypothetical protein TTHERM_00145360 [Tetrahymena thermophila SB210]